MNQKTFEIILAQRISRMKETLTNKAQEYSANNDRLHNFKVAAGFGMEKPEIALWGMLTKHLVSICDMVDATFERDQPSVESLNEKIGDAINYLVLLEALFVERIGILTNTVGEGYPGLRGDSR